MFSLRLQKLKTQRPVVSLSFVIKYNQVEIVEIGPHYEQSWNIHVLYTGINHMRRDLFELILVESINIAVNAAQSAAKYM